MGRAIDLLEGFLQCFEFLQLHCGGVGVCGGECGRVCVCTAGVYTVGVCVWEVWGVCVCVCVCEGC